MATRRGPGWHFRRLLALDLRALCTLLCRTVPWPIFTGHVLESERLEGDIEEDFGKLDNVDAFNLLQISRGVWRFLGRVFRADR